MFSRSQRICLKSNSERRGIILDDPMTVNGYNIYSVMFDDGKQSTVNEVDLMPEVIVESAWDKLANNLFGDHNNFGIASTINKIKNASANTISTLKASKTIFMPYQFIPLVKLLNSDNKRIIVADEVGLGKTIEAGHILLEFASRGQLNNFLIVCLNSIQEKWRDEMENKFNIRLKIYSSLKDFQADLVEHQKGGANIAGIINYDKFRNKKNSDFFAENAVALDLIVFDEAHTLRNKTNARNALENFTSIAKSIVMLTATPLMTGLDNLFNLILLLDPKEYSKFEVFQNSINVNKPFIKAFNDITAGKKLDLIAEELTNAEVEVVFKYGKQIDNKIEKLTDSLADDKLFHSLLKDLKSGDNSREFKNKIKQKLVNLNTLNHIYTRTRKNQVLTNGELVTRNANVMAITMSEEEQEIYEDVILNYEDSGIGAVQVKRKIASSFFANKFTETELQSANLYIDFEDSKYNALKSILNQNVEKIIVFSFFRKTLLYLQNRLKNDGYNVGLIFGGIDVKDRNKTIDSFRNDAFNILLTSEVGSTGLDMQFCNCMVNYDLPWNPMVVEQRIGRIDRIGQTSPVINIFNLIHSNTIEEVIYERLYKRINIFRESLGNLDEILGEKENFFEGVIEEIYKTHLTKEQIEQKLDTIADAVETNKIIIVDVENKLKDSFSNDAYFANEIKSIEQKRKYIMPVELKDFIDRIKANHLTTMLFNKTSNEFIYEIQQNSPDEIFSFVEREYDSTNTELVKMFKEFKRRNYDQNIRVTFDQDYAFKNKNVEYISAYHPLINAISNYFSRNRFAQNSVYRFSLNSKNFNEEEFIGKNLEGFYFLITYNLTISKNVNGKISEVTTLKSLLIDLQSESNPILGDEIADLINAESQKYKESYSANNAVVFNTEFSNELSKMYVAETFKRKLQTEEEEKLIFESEVQRKTTQEIAEIERRIERIQYNLDVGIGLENPQLNEISNLNLLKNKLVDQTSNSKLEVSDNLVSLNLIHIYG